MFCNSGQTRLDPSQAWAYREQKLENLGLALAAFFEVRDRQKEACHITIPRPESIGRR